MYVLKPHIVYYWRAELGADGKDYRANSVHAPFPGNSQQSSAFKGSRSAVQWEAPFGSRARARAFEYSPHRNHEAVS